MSCDEIFHKRELNKDGVDFYDDIDPDGFDRGKYPVRVRCLKENGREQGQIKRGYSCP